MIRSRLGCLAATLLLLPVAATAQDSTVRRDSVPGPVRLLRALTIGSEAEERDRALQVLGERPIAGMLARSLSSRLTLATADTITHGLISPELLVVNNSALPFSLNDGLLWAGRGTSVRMSGGIAAARGPWRLVLMPELAYTENADFVDVDQSQWYRPQLDWDRYSGYASPWNRHPFLLDLPVRFGPGKEGWFGLGQSALWWEGRGVAVGVTTENQWWGPGIHDALLMTNNAAGVPHLFVRTARPLRTRLGEFEGRFMLGRLSESKYFDFDPSNDHRSLSGAVVTFRPGWEPDLTLGLARAVYAPLTETSALAGRALDVFRPFDRPNDRPWTDSTLTGGRDQLASVFARWVFPRHGWEVYGEWGRSQRPANLRDFLLEPNHTQGWVLGGQHVRRIAPLDAMLRLQAEFTQMEQSPTYRTRPTHSWYTSRAAPQGYTHGGQVIGATIGPGSSHQWIAADLFGPRWSAGLFLGRWRFNTDAMFLITFPPGTGSCEYDVTLYPGGRASFQHRLIGLVRAEVVLANRLNAFHQNNSGCPTPPGGHYRDVRNTTLRLTLQPLGIRW